ncbi:MAG: CDP-diacylglycerol--glycerol-3-phosphate 3-phosphatidyltransferase [Rhodobacteraceae bacterium]|nr:CDP-diacylglycerol--glycerol-3-phosphate 3-phosphatidyltransferase [Paracoccaceae bacterium]
MTWTVPNTLTCLRLATAPMLVLIFLCLPRPYADWAAVPLFVAASLTDFVDGHLARGWNQKTKLGGMLDPIADKAMVVVALAILIGYSPLGPSWLLLPGTIILFREVFVSGLRQFLGATAGTLNVTRLAKWKTTAQMVAITILLAQGIFEHRGMYPVMVTNIPGGTEGALHGIRSLSAASQVCGWAGLVLLWLAAVLTLVTGIDYFRKAIPHLTEPRP